MSETVSSSYAVEFNEENRCFSPTSMENQIFIRCVQNWCNDKLMTQKHLFLNEVYDALGIQRVAEGQLCGWLLNGEGDGRVEFEISPVPNSDALVIDFNVDGHILDKAF